jgi:MFS family permease
MALNLGLIALVPSGPLLYPVVGILAIGTGLAIPALTTLISRRVSEREQGKVMGGQQAILSMTLVLGPLISGLAFDLLGVPSPYWIGGLLAALALLVAATALLPNHSAVLAGRHIVEPLFSGRRSLRKLRKPRA